MAKQYIRHLDQDGNLVFSNVKTVGELELLRTNNKQDVVSAINEIVDEMSYVDDMKAVKEALQNIVGKYDTLYSNYEDIVLDLGGQQLDINSIKGNFVSQISEAQSDLESKLSSSRTELLEITESIKKQVLDNYEEVDGKLQNVTKEIVNTKEELSSKMSKADYEENVGLNKWTVSKYYTDKDYSIDYPKIDHLEGKVAIEVIEVADSTSLFPYTTSQKTLLHYFTNVKQTVAKTIQFNVNHDGGLAVLLNGAYVYYKVGSNSGNVSISLRAGWNTIEFLIGVNNKVGKLNLASKISDNVDKLSAIIGVGDKNESRLNRAETQIKQTNEAITLKANKDTVESMGNEISSQKAELNVMAGEISSKVSQEDFNNYTGRLESAETQISQTATDITALAKQKDLDTLNGKFSEADTIIKQTAKDILLKASQEEVDTVKGTVSNHTEQISIQKGQIELMVEKEEFDKTTGIVSSHSTSIKSLEDEILLRATKKEFDTVTGRVGSLEGALTVQAEQIASKVGKVEVDKAIADIKLGGRNLIASNSITELDKSVDTNGWQVSLWAGSPPFINNANLIKILQPNTEYTISYKFRLDTLNENTIPFNQNTHGTLRFYSGVSGYPVDVIFMEQGTKTVEEASAWKVGSVIERRCTFTTPAELHDTKANYRILAYTRRSYRDGLAIGNEKGTFYDIMLEKGNKGSEYAPAPEEVDVKIKTSESNMKQTAEQIATSVTKTEVDKLKLGGRNLIPFSDFKDISKWVSWYVGTTISSDTFADGTPAIKGTLIDVATQSRMRLTSLSPVTQGGKVFNLIKGKEYTLSYIVKASDELVKAELVGIRYEVDITANQDFAGLDLSSCEFYNEEEGSRIVTYKFVAQYTSKARVMFGFGLGNKAVNGSWAKFGKIMLSEGNKYVTWTPSDEDVKGELSIIQSSITQTAEDITSKVSKTDYNGNTVSSMINQDATTIRLKAEKIELTGAVTISDLGADVKKKVVGGIRKVRYIRDWLSGSNINTGNYWVEIKAMAGDVNRALGTTIISSHSVKDNLSVVIDGDITASKYYSNASPSTPTKAEKGYVQIDLKEAFEDIDTIKIWHYYGGSRTFNGTKVEISEDGVTWETLFDSEITGTYKETSDGLTLLVNSGKALSNVADSINNAITTIDRTGVTIKDGNFGLTESKGGLQKVLNSNGIEAESNPLKNHMIALPNYIEDHSFELIQHGSSVVSGTKHYLATEYKNPQFGYFEGFGKWTNNSGTPRIYNELMTRSVTSDAPFGNKAVLLNSANNLRQDLQLTVGRTYTLSFHIKKPTDITAGANAKIVLDFRKGELQEFVTAYEISFPTTANFVRHAVTFTVPSTTQITWIYLQSSNTGWVVYDGIQLVEGDRVVYYNAEEGLWSLQNSDELRVKRIAISKSNQYLNSSSDNYGLEMNNSDMIGINNIIFADPSETYSEGLQFPRTGATRATDLSNYDSIRALDGVAYFNAEPMHTENTGYSIVKSGIGSGVFMSGSQTVVLEKSIRNTPHGIVLIWCRYVTGVGVENNNYQFTFIPKGIMDYSTRGMRIILQYGTSNLLTKYVYMTNATTLTGYADNSVAPSNNIALIDVREF